ncbi:hypothetical protein K438DRAFT_2027895 [Mycena galopus ATCC 62051]|nr:hypothetical protein K438DRAFT_2027895 [Mycena galopus ATCC 62051]
MFGWMASSKKGGSWVLISKECHNLRVVPKSKPDRMDIAYYQIPKTKKHSVMVFIALTKTVPDHVYKSWYTRPAIQEASSGVDSDNDVVMDVSSDDNNSDYDPAKDPDADPDANVKNHTPLKVERYKTRPDPLPYKCKIESQNNSEFEDLITVKRQKMAGSKANPTQTASSSKQTDPLFLPDSDSDSSSQSIPVQRRKIAPLPKAAAAYFHPWISPPPKVVTRKSVPPWHPEHESKMESFTGSYTNPWSKAYKPPCC